nr:hypothetical protein CDL12_15730 [Ipomoea batatas]GMC77563.1 hypothetical protein CDL12_15730 [Ipomoea batatas]GME21672.1 hypothetical protein CDL12_15730 [Ipomoea batatas]
MEICKTMLVFFLVVSSTLLSALTASRNLKEISSENIKAAEEDEALMDLMSGGTGANTHHDPKPPGSND